MHSLFYHKHTEMHDRRGCQSVVRPHSTSGMREFAVTFLVALAPLPPIVVCHLLGQLRQYFSHSTKVYFLIVLADACRNLFICSSWIHFLLGSCICTLPFPILKVLLIYILCLVIPPKPLAWKHVKILLLSTLYSSLLAPA